jgi:hypothetical protein
LGASQPEESAVGIEKQAKQSSSALSRFLDERLPQWKAVVEQWTRGLESAQGRGSAVLGRNRASIGCALELRMELDLADTPPRMTELSYLPIPRCTVLLEAAGFEHTGAADLPAVDTTDPLRLNWARAHYPISIGDTEHAALAACLDLAWFRAPIHTWGHERAVDERRSSFAASANSGRFGNDADMMDVLASCWSTYLATGRQALLALGEPVVVAPELANGFGEADLVIGRTLIDVKLAIEPDEEDVTTWVRQVLGYVLLDRRNVLHVDQVAIYCGWQARLLTYPLASLLTEADSRGLRDLETLRVDFHDALRSDLDDYLSRRAHRRATGATPS